MNIVQKLAQIARRNNSLVCVGLDSEWERLPQPIKKRKYPQFEFNKRIIDATHDLVMAYKPNSAFYEARGATGITELKMTCDYLKKTYPDIVLILDAKRADIGSTNEGYVKYVFDYLGADAVTIHPYVGGEAMKPFLERPDKFCFILCRTSNPGAGEFQDLKVGKIPLYQMIAKNVSENWNTHDTCGLVVGATYPEELGIVRRIVGDMPLLVPGIGAQGGDVQTVVRNGLTKKGSGLIINASRGIIFAGQTRDFPQKARAECMKLNSKINEIRNKKIH